MKPKQKKYSKMAHFAFTENQWNTIQEYYQQSTCQSLSEYIRNVLLGKPITFFYRNKSFDEFVSVAIFLGEQLESLRKVLSSGDSGDQKMLLLILSQLKETFNKLIDACLQESKTRNR